MAQGYSGIFGGCTLGLNGHKYNLKGSTKYKAYGFLVSQWSCLSAAGGAPPGWGSLGVGWPRASV
jgi:hypothetical protein